MSLMPPIDEATPAKIRIDEVEKHRETRKVNIEILTKVNKDSLEEYLLRPVKLITMARDFIKLTTQERKEEVSTKVCYGELYVENMHSEKLQNIMVNYSLYKEYRDRMQA
jgi:hypothetical protein